MCRSLAQHQHSALLMQGNSVYCSRSIAPQEAHVEIGMADHAPAPQDRHPLKGHGRHQPPLLIRAAAPPEPWHNTICRWSMAEDADRTRRIGTCVGTTASICQLKSPATLRSAAAAYMEIGSHIGNVRARSIEQSVWCRCYRLCAYLLAAF